MSPVKLLGGFLLVTCSVACTTKGVPARPGSRPAEPGQIEFTLRLTHICSSNRSAGETKYSAPALVAFQKWAPAFWVGTTDGNIRLYRYFDFGSGAKKWTFPATVEASSESYVVQTDTDWARAIPTAQLRATFSDRSIAAEGTLIEGAQEAKRGLEHDLVVIKDTEGNLLERYGQMYECAAESLSMVDQ